MGRLLGVAVRREGKREEREDMVIVGENEE